MMTPIHFYAAGLPKGQPRPKAFSRGGIASVYDPGTAEGWKGQVALAARPFIGAIPKDHGPLYLRLDFYMPRPNSHHRAGKAENEVKPTAPKFHAGKPDADNLAKAIMDALTQISIWRDDATVVELRVRKFYYTGNVPGCFIEIREA